VKTEAGDFLYWWENLTWRKGYENRGRGFSNKLDTHCAKGRHMDLEAWIG